MLRGVGLKENLSCIGESKEEGRYAGLGRASLQLDTCVGVVAGSVHWALLQGGLSPRSRAWDTSVSTGVLLKGFEWCEYLHVWGDQTEIQGRYITIANTN